MPLRDNDVVAFVPTRDPTAARAFYELTLGLRFVSEDPFAVVFDANGTMLRITKVREYTPASFTILGWVVQDIKVSVKKLMEKSVAFERYEGLEQDHLGIWTSPTGSRVAWFKDPDGNVLSISQH